MALSVESEHSLYTINDTIDLKFVDYHVTITII